MDKSVTIVFILSLNFRINFDTNSSSEAIDLNSS